MGIYGSETIELSPYTSILLQPNLLFVQYVKVEKSDGRKCAAVLYGMYKTPILNDSKIWLVNMNVSMGIHSIKQWGFFLNKGSEINISYNVKSSSPLMLIIAQEGSSGVVEGPSLKVKRKKLKGKRAIVRRLISSSTKRKGITRE